MENKYYLYRHIRLDSNKPFYIGVGTKKSDGLRSKHNGFVWKYKSNE